MEKSTPTYQGKPTAYLDHNILDLLVKNPSLSFKTELKENFQIIYSDENLKEIKRTGESGSKHLQLLEELGAMYLKLITTPDFTLTETITKISPFVTFESYCDSIEAIYKHTEQSMNQSSLKFYGGRNDADFDDINREQTEAFEDLLSHLQDSGNKLFESKDFLDFKDLISESEFDFPDIKALFSECTKEMKRTYDIALAQTTTELRKNIDYEEEHNFSAVKFYREYTGLGPKQLNNIKPPNVIQKIWEAHSEVGGFEEHCSSLEQFYGISKSPLYNREMFLFEKILTIYNFLNFAGYQPDSKMKKERRFIAAMSDAGHASMGSCADFVFSSDEAFVKKASACYEFFNTKSQVVPVTVNVE